MYGALIELKGAALGLPKSGTASASLRPHHFLAACELGYAQSNQVVQIMKWIGS